MGTVLQFAEELSVGEGWSPGERAQLREIGVQLAGVLDEVELVFGKTERGDPWCAVTDSSGEVLLHIARIDGAFVVHSPGDDRMAEGPDLWGTAARLLGDALRERRGVILPFPGDNWAPPTALAIIVAIALQNEFGQFAPEEHTSVGAMPGTDTADAAASAEDEGGSDAPDARPPLLSAAETRPHTDDAGQEPASAAVVAARPATAEAAAEPQRRGDAPAAEVASGPAQALRLAQDHDDAARREAAAQGHPALSSGPTEATVSDFAGGRHESAPRLVEGGQGADRLVLGPAVVAEGKGGADVFVAPAPAPAAANSGPVLTGVIADMHKGEGDRLELGGGRFTQVTGQTQVVDILSTFRGAPGMGDLPTVSGRKVTYDVNGDGRPDGYVLIADHAGAWVDALRNVGSRDSRPWDDRAWGGRTGGDPGSAGVSPPSIAAPPGDAHTPWAPAFEAPSPPPLAEAGTDHMPHAIAPYAPPELDLPFV